MQKTVKCSEGLSRSGNTAPLSPCMYTLKPIYANIGHLAARAIPWLGLSSQGNLF
jgi:hypothetical protein